jgi:hypothetical protein
MAECACDFQMGCEVLIATGATVTATLATDEFSITLRYGFAADRWGHRTITKRPIARAAQLGSIRSQWLLLNIQPKPPTLI